MGADNSGSLCASGDLQTWQGKGRFLGEPGGGQPRGAVRSRPPDRRVHDRWNELHETNRASVVALPSAQMPAEGSPTKLPSRMW